MFYSLSLFNFQCFIYYGAFTSVNFPYKLFLALRFFVPREGGWYRSLRRVTILHKFLCLGLNGYWQALYLGRLWPDLLSGGVWTGQCYRKLLTRIQPI